MAQSDVVNAGGRVREGKGRSGRQQMKIDTLAVRRRPKLCASNSESEKQTVVWKLSDPRASAR